MKATITPPREPDTTVYQCGRCGISRAYDSRHTRREYCQDCLPHARLFGWAPPKRMPA